MLSSKKSTLSRNLSCLKILILSLQGLYGVSQLMKKYILKTSLIATFFLAATFSYASKQIDQIPCPSFSTIQNNAPMIDFAKAYEDHNDLYRVYTSNPAFYESNLPWYIEYVGARAMSANEAIKIGIEKAKNVTVKIWETASHPNDDSYFCFYTNTPRLDDVVFVIGGKFNKIESVSPLFKR